MNKIVSYFNEVTDEMYNKVTWPTTSELMQTLAITVIATLIFSVVVWLMDVIFSNSMSFLYNLNS